MARSTKRASSSAQRKKNVFSDDEEREYCLARGLRVQTEGGQGNG